jgi:hypothetical protein
LRWPFGGIASMWLNNAEEPSWLEQLATEYGEYLGLTNGDGELNYSFSEEGLYIIVGIKEEYVPGVTFIRVGEVSRLGRLFPAVGSRAGVAQGLERLEQVVPQLTQLRACKAGE